MTDFSHLNAIQDRISREKSRVATAKTEAERAFRVRQVEAAEKELAAEYKFLGISQTADDVDMSDEELLAELVR